MARISRLISISDTTVKRHGWQVHFAGTSVRNPGKNRLTERPNARNATPMEWRFAVLRWSLASQIPCGRWIFHRAYYRLSLPVIPIFRAALFADALAGCLLLFGLAGLVSSSRYITGTLVAAIRLPFLSLIYFNYLQDLLLFICLYSGRSDKN